MPKRIKDKDLAEIIFDWMEAGRPTLKETYRDTLDILLADPEKYIPRHHMAISMAKFMLRRGYSLDNVKKVTNLPLAELEEIEINIKATH